MSMLFRITESPFRAETPINPDAKVDGFSAPTRAAHSHARARSPNGMGGDRRNWLSARALGETAGAQGTFGYPATCAVVNGERRSRTLKSPRGLSFPIY